MDKITVHPVHGSDPDTLDALSQFLRVPRGAGPKDLHHRALGLIARSVDSSGNVKVVGYLSSDPVCGAFDRTASATLLAGIDATELGYTSSSAAYIHQLKVDKHAQGEATIQLLQAAFLLTPTLAHLLLVSHNELDPKEQPALAAHFSKAMRSSTGLWLYDASRKSVLPALQVRRARLEDHDELLPVVAAAAESCPRLAALPASCNPDDPFALTRLITSQDSENIVLVAEDGSKLVGLLAATCQLDISSLQLAFDLGPYDGFLQPDVYESFETAALQVATEKLMTSKPQQEMEQQDTDQDAASLAGDADSSSSHHPSDAEVQQELLALLTQALSDPHQQQGLQHRLTAVTMLCMLPGYEARAVEFMRPVFQEFKGKDFCALSLPHSAPEPPLARLMTQLPQLPGSSYPDVLLLLHRAVCLGPDELGWQVRLAVPEDMIGLHGLIGGLSNARELQEAFLHALGCQGAVVATVMGELVGMAASRPSVDLELLTANFKLHQRLPASCLDSVAGHAELVCCILNPIFSNMTGALLAGTLQLLGKSVLHYMQHPAEVVPEWLYVMQQQPPWHSPVTGSKEVEFSLYSFTKHMGTATKQVINSKIVIVGASTTALSCIEQLLMELHLQFNNITLLAPGGVAVGGVACDYSASLIGRMGLQAGITLLDRHLVQIDVGQQLLGLSDGSTLPYDLLVVATGLQDQLAAAIAGSCPEAAQFVLSSQQLSRGKVSPEAAAGLQGVLLYGSDLTAFHVMATLQEAGVSASSITWVNPDQQQRHPLLPLLYALAAQLQLELPAPQQGQLLELLPTADGTQAVATLQAGDSGPPQQLNLDLLVGCGRHGPSATAAHCLRDAGLVFDGRLVVDHNFRTNEPAVMGAGPAVKFSRCYSLPEVHQEHYSSSELGAALAASIVRGLTAGSIGPIQANNETAPAAAAAAQQQGHQQPRQQPQQLPALKQGKVVGCRLPGGHVFAFAGCPDALQSPALVPPAGGRSLISLSRQTRTAVADGGSTSDAVAAPGANQGAGAEALINICLDACDVIHHIAYLGPMVPSAAKLAALVGLPFSYLAPALQLPYSDAKAVDNLGAAAAAALEASSGFCAGLRREAADVETSRSVVPTSAGHQQRMTRHPVSMRGVPGVLPGPEPGVHLLTQQDVLARLSEPWAQLLFHDGFCMLRRQLIQQCSSRLNDVATAHVQCSGGGDDAAAEAQPLLLVHTETVEDLAVEYFRSCGATELPAGYRAAGCIRPLQHEQPAAAATIN